MRRLKRQQRHFAVGAAMGLAFSVAAFGYAAEGFVLGGMQRQQSFLLMDQSTWSPEGGRTFGDERRNYYQDPSRYQQGYGPSYGNEGYNNNNNQGYNNDNNYNYQNGPRNGNYYNSNVAAYNNNDGAFYTSNQEQAPYNGFAERPVSYYVPQQQPFHNFPTEFDRNNVPVPRYAYANQQQPQAPPPKQQQQQQQQQQAVPHHQSFHHEQQQQEQQQPSQTVANEFELKVDENTDEPVIIQGGSLRTYSFGQGVERSQLYLATEGRPLNGILELWCGPDNTPQKCKFYSEDGYTRPIRLFVETQQSDNTAVCIKNTGSLEFPVSAWIDPNIDSIAVYGQQKTVQGGAIHTFPFDSTVSAVQILMETDGRPLQARIELMQGPNNSKQLMEIYTEDGKNRPFFTILETPGNNNVVRLVNTGSIEFPLHAVVEPYAMAEYNEVTGGWDEDYSYNSQGSSSGTRGWSDPAEKMIQEYNSGNTREQSGFYHQRL